MSKIVYPTRRKSFKWTNPRNWWRTRRKFLRSDFSNLWRYAYRNQGEEPDPERSVGLETLLGPGKASGRLLILGDTGEGDRSQYSLLPLIRTLDPDFMIINGDLAYPAGNQQDYIKGFFEPYRGLGIPIWAVPGNHEYYSRGHGEEFHEVFCTRMWQKLWRDYGLRQSPQPGTYWELTGDAGLPLAIVGVDTGKKGNLDGGRLKDGDDRQHHWLEERLLRADRLGLAVIVLFHIPSLVNQTRARGTGLLRLHQILSGHSSVKLVVTAHEHSFQRYTAATFKKYLVENDIAPNPDFAAEYWVCGGSGAYVSNTRFGNDDYLAQGVFPSPAQWARTTKAVPKLIARLPWLKKTSLGSVTADTDSGKHLSFIMVDVNKGQASATPVWMEDVQKLYRGNERIDVMNPPPIQKAQLTSSIRSQDKLVLYSP